VRTTSVERVLAQRLATQRLTSSPAASAADVVRLLGCVQAQERDHAFFSLGLRSRSSTYTAVRDAFDRGEFVRTHILRPTWHFVAPEDLRWILALTSPRVEASFAARTRAMGLEPVAVLTRAIGALVELLRGRAFLTRDEIGLAFSHRRNLPPPGEPLGHLLLIAELRGVICSGPMKGVHHSYALVDEVVRDTALPTRDEALVRLARRFFGGHGPATIADFTRWSSLTVADTRRALAELGDVLELLVVDDTELWFDPTVVVPRRASAPDTWLLPVYDEIVLAHRGITFGASADHPLGGRADPHWAPIVHRQTQVGVWKRTLSRDGVSIETRLAASLDEAGRRAVAAAEATLADFVERPLDRGTGR
jgi:hypothetical protein